MSTAAACVLARRVAVLEQEAEIARRLASFDDQGPDLSRRYRFISREAGDFPVAVLCRVCGVSRSAYYVWVKKGDGPDPAVIDEAFVANRIFDIWKRSRRRYGAPRVTAELCRDGVSVNRKRVARLMAELGIAGLCGRKKLKTTKRDHTQPLAGDLVARDFTAEEPDELWVTDITYIPTDEGWLFLASILDVCTRTLLGWSMADHMRTELCLDALDAAARSRGRVRFAGTVLHSDHGCQYTSTTFGARCRAMGIVQSMGTVGDSYDNALAESFWASLKREVVDCSHFTTRDEARIAIFEWIIWYNTERLHSSLGYMSPVEYEKSLQTQHAA